MVKEETLTKSARQDELIAAVYEESRSLICGYIGRRIGDRAEAEDMTQEVFCRLLEYDYFLNEDTILHFIFSIARNLVIDYLRRHARSAAASEYFFTHSAKESNCTEDAVAAKELTDMERKVVAALPGRRRQVYSLCVIYENTAEDVSKNLQLSKRTVENHLFAARIQVRTRLKDYYQADLTKAMAG